MSDILRTKKENPGYSDFIEGADFHANFMLTLEVIMLE